MVFLLKHYLFPHSCSEFLKLIPLFAGICVALSPTVIINGLCIVQNLKFTMCPELKMVT